MASPLTVTEVRLAFECPRLFYLGHQQGCKTLFHSDQSVTGLGTAFHQLSNRCVQALKLDGSLFQVLAEDMRGLSSEELAQRSELLAKAMRSHLYSTVFFPYLQTTLKADPSRATALATLWKALQRLIRRWSALLVSNRRSCTADAVFYKTFIAQELNIDHTFTLPDETLQTVQGRLDSLVYDFARQRLCVVEYKTYQTTDNVPQLAQVALYSTMLRLRLGVPINSAIYSVLPDWEETEFSWEDLQVFLNRIIPTKLQKMRDWLAWQPMQFDPPPATNYPHLCDLCPQYEPCQTYFVGLSSGVSPALPRVTPALPTPAPTAKPSPRPSRPKADAPKLPRPDPTPQPKATPQPKPAADDTASQGVAAQLVRTLHSFGVGVDNQGVAVGPAFVRVRLKPHLGVKVGAIMRLGNDLRVQLGLMAPPLIAPQAGYVSVDLPRPDRQTAHFKDYVPQEQQPVTAPVKIAIGVNLDGQLIEADLSDPNTCHFLVGGTTGSGKSEFLRSLLLSILVRHSPNQLKIVLVDPKRVTFPEFEHIPWLMEPIVKDTEDAIALMETLVGEMEDRYQRFEISRCQDLIAYNQRHPHPLPRIVCIFDEYADFMAEKDMKAALEQSIKRLGAMARAAGIHLIIATQRPEAKVVTPLIRSNLPGRVALRTASDADSAIILGGKQTDAVNLLGKGDLLYLQGAQLLRLQSLFAQDIQFTGSRP